jgi:hypothetical protein
MRTTLAILALLAFAPALRAQGGAGGDDEYDIAAAMRRVEKLMADAEKSLLDSVSRDRAAEAGQQAAEEIDKLLKGSQKTGEEIVGKINEILENLPQQGGGGSGQPMPKPEDEGQKKPQDGQQVGDRDPKNSRQGEPKGGHQPKPEDRKEEATKPPPEEAKEKVPVDRSQEWLARLPDQVREDLLNRRFDRIPEEYRRLIEAWTKKMAETDGD